MYKYRNKCCAYVYINWLIGENVNKFKKNNQKVSELTMLIDLFICMKNCISISHLRNQSISTFLEDIPLSIKKHCYVLYISDIPKKLKILYTAADTDNKIRIILNT